jgi:hypothetical protein
MWTNDHIDDENMEEYRLALQATFKDIADAGYVVVWFEDECPSCGARFKPWHRKGVPGWLTRHRRGCYDGG